jgi:hypothetical protein
MDNEDSANLSMSVVSKGAMKQTVRMPYRTSTGALRGMRDFILMEYCRCLLSAFCISKSYRLRSYLH